MDAPESGQILRLDLEPAELTVVQELNRWLVANPDAEWKPSPRFRLVEQCSDRGLEEIIMPLTKDSRIAILKASQSRWDVKEGELIPFFPSGSGTVIDRENRFSLEYGTKISISKNVHVEISGDNVLYILWRVRVV